MAAEIGGPVGIGNDARVFPGGRAGGFEGEELRKLGRLRIFSDRENP